MPVIAAARAGEAAGAKLTRNQCIGIGAVLLAGGVLIFLGVKASPGGGPKTPTAVSEDTPPFVPPPNAPVIGVDQHIGGFIFTPHRYPRMAGGELSAVINGGHATLRLPHQKDMDWLVRPPSEVTL